MRADSHAHDSTDHDLAVVDPARLVERYVALWNEPDPEVRRTVVRELWARGGEHVLDPPQELRQPAGAYEEFVAPGQFVFRPRDDAARLRNIVKFNWEMVSTATGEVAGSGSRCSCSTTRGASRSITSSSRDERVVEALGRVG